MHEKCTRIYLTILWLVSLWPTDYLTCELWVEVDRLTLTDTERYELNQIWSQVPSHDQGCVTCMHGNACTRHEVPRRDPSLIFILKRQVVLIRWIGVEYFTSVVGTIVSDTIWGWEMVLVSIVIILVRRDFIPHILAKWNDTRYFLGSGRPTIIPRSSF